MRLARPAQSLLKQILSDLGLHRIRLLTNHPRRVVGLEAFGIEIVEQARRGVGAELLLDKRHLSLYNSRLIRTFRHRGLRRLWEGDPSRVNAALRDRLENVLSVLDAAGAPSDVDLPGYRLHALKGELKGFWSITVSGNWRVTFRIEDGNAFDVDLTNYH